MLEDPSSLALNIKNDFNIKCKTVNAFITKRNKAFQPKIILEKSLVEYNLYSKNIASCDQVHSNKVRFIKKPGIYKKTDGLVCSMDNNVVLLIQTADCVPIFIIDESIGLIGLVHSGWKGTYQNIVISALSIFFDVGSKQNNIKVYLGPSIKQCCYEIKEDVSKYFDKKYIISKGNGLYLNLVGKIQDDIILKGINSNNVYTSKICTFENEEYYSHRKNNDNNKRIYSVIGPS